MTFPNIPLKSALIEKRVDRDSEGEFNGHGEKEWLPTEYQYEFEQETFNMFRISMDISEY